MIDFTEQQLREVEEVEARFGSYGQLVHGVGDTSLTDLQRQHCIRVMTLGNQKFGAELSRKFGTYYPLSALAAKIDAGIAKHTINRKETV